MTGPVGSRGVVLLLLASLVSAAVVKDPKDLCSWKDPARDKCFQGAVQKLIPHLVKGLPKYGIFPIDPLHIDLLDLSHAPGRTLDVRHKFMNVDLIGLKSGIIDAVRIDRDANTIEIDATLKEPFKLKGNYVSVGKVLTLPVNGAGPFEITLYDMKATLKYKGHQEKKKGKMHMRMDEVHFPLKVSKMHVNFKNLFKGNAQISDAINTALNENWEDVLEDMKPSFETAIGQAFKEITNRALVKIPISDLIKDFA
uniref:Protein takeout n=1 Tax=Lygus hesperus TaxID=30085 RepID=A0A146LU05_LYGHE